MANDAVLKLEGKEYALPTMVGSEGEKAIDVRNLRAQTGHITYDDGFGNTGSCTSAITFIDGDADRKSTRLNSSHVSESRMPSSA